MTNVELVSLLRKMKAAYEILGENRFKIIAYDRAADSISQLSTEVYDLWKNQRLGEIPGIGSTLQKHIDELCNTGTVKHFTDTLSKLPSSIFPLLLVPGIGPKKAYKLVTTLHLKDEKNVITDLEKAAIADKISGIEGFGEKSQADIITSISLYKKGAIKENRITLSDADRIAGEIITHMHSCPYVKKIDTLGSLRRQVATIGDIDISAATTEPEKTIAHFLLFPHRDLIEKGPSGASIVLSNGRQVDFRVQLPDKYGAMLQYFTGSKNHNIKLRTLALSRGLSLNEYGMKHVKTGKMSFFTTEEQVYKKVGLTYIPPELREDKGEVESAEKGILPDLISYDDIQGDLHIHTNYNLEPSHDLGNNSLYEYLIKAEQKSYAYIGLSDHNPSVSMHSNQQIVDIMKRRKEFYEQSYYSYLMSTKSRVHIVIMCEVDILPDGTLALPEEAFEYVDAIIVSVHSSFTQSREDMTMRLLKALTAHPKVRVLGHPTGRLLTKREGIDVDWKQVFDVCVKRNIAMEINAYPMRLDLPDGLVFDARRAGVRFIIDSDSHAVDQMDVMKYGISVARRGWAQKRDIVNTMDYTQFMHWLVKGE